MIKWIELTPDTHPPKDGEYFVSNGHDMTTSWYDGGTFEASSNVQSSYDMAIAMLDMAVKYWAVIDADMLPNKG